jgi:long-subunit fatty acid transport protein
VANREARGVKHCESDPQSQVPKVSTMQKIRAKSIGLFLTIAATNTIARANVEPPPAYDARSVGIGSTGVAHVHNGASLFHNPAAMQGVKDGAATLVFSPFLPQLSAPLAGPDTEVKGARSFFPMFLVGGVYRVNPKLTVGLAAFPTMGFGAKYENLAAMGGATINAKLAAFEVAPGVAYAVTDFLSIGATYRITYMSYGMEQPMIIPPTADNPAGGMIQTKTNLSGLGFWGAQLGLFAQASPTTRLGLTYRNQVTVNMSGETEMPTGSYDTEMKFASPHSFKLGIAQSLLNNALLLALDLRFALYKTSNKELAAKVEVPGVGTQTDTVRLDWGNVFGMYAGAEYRIKPEGPAVRLGYSLSQSATSKDHAQAILPPPALQHAIHGGAGVTVSKVDLDLGGYYFISSTHLDKALPPGDYAMNGLLLALSGTYRW